VTLLPGDGSNARDDVVIVQFRRGYLDLPSSVLRCSPVALDIADDGVREALENAGVVEIERLAKTVDPDNPVIYSKYGRRFDLSDLTRTYYLRTSGSQSARDILGAIRRCAYAYDYAEPVYPLEMFGFPEDGSPGDSVFLLGRQPHLDSTNGFGLNMPAVWPITTGSPEIRLGVYDHPVCPSHRDLVIRDSSQTPDSVGYRFEYVDVCDSSLAPSCGPNPHGQWVIGLAAALTHNVKQEAPGEYEGIAGISGGSGRTCKPDSCGVAVQFYDYYYGCGSSTEGYVEMVNRAIREGTDVINRGCPSRSWRLRDEGGGSLRPIV